jgi:hypothetical protein
MKIESIQKGVVSISALPVNALKVKPMPERQADDVPKALKNATVTLKNEKIDAPIAEEKKTQHQRDKEAKTHSLKSLSKDLRKDVKAGLKDAKADLKADKGTFKLKEKTDTHIKTKDEVQLSSQANRNTQSSTSSSASSKTGTSNNYTSTANYQASANTTYGSSSALQSDSTTKTGTGKQAVTVKTEINQEKDASGTSSVNSDRSIKSDVAVSSYNKNGVAVRETSVASKDAQTVSRQGSSETITDTERTVTTKAKGSPAQESYSHQTVETDVNSSSKQSSVTEGQSNARQETSSEAIHDGKMQGKQTTINATSSYDGTSVSDSASHADSSTTIVNMNRDGDVVSASTNNRATDTASSQKSSIEEDRTSSRTISQATDGKNSIIKDTEKRSYDSAQATHSTTTTTNTALDADMNALNSKTSTQKADSKVTREEDYETSRQTKRGPDGQEIKGETSGSSETSISTHLQNTAANGAVSERQIDRKINTETDSQFEASLKERTANGTKTYDFSSIDVSDQKTKDLTREGANSVLVNTEVRTAKELNGNISFSPKADEVGATKAAPGNVAVSFGSYNGMAGGFKFDSGEMSFNLSFQSAQMTDQDTVKNGQNGSASASSSQSGQLSDTTLAGKLTSSINENGDRVIEFSANYNRSGEKFVINKSGEKQDVGVGEKDTSADIHGKFVISKNGDVTSVSREFDMYKKETGKAEGTSEDVAKSSLAQNDPLRNLFSYDGHGIKANLGFAAFNIAITA